MTGKLLGSILIGATLAACGAGDGGLPGPTGPATPELAADLQFLREEEKLARDVYLTLYDAWQLAPHQNIAESEQTHTDRVLDLLVALDLPDPVVDDTVGVFVNPQLAGLYVELVATGRRTEVASLEVGATIEDLDLRDIEHDGGPDERRWRARDLRGAGVWIAQSPAELLVAARVARRDLRAALPEPDRLRRHRLQ
jgi:hypothetical protein